MVRWWAKLFVLIVLSTFTVGCADLAQVFGNQNDNNETGNIASENSDESNSEDIDTSSAPEDTSWQVADQEQRSEEDQQAYDQAMAEMPDPVFYSGY